MQFTNAADSSSPYGRRPGTGAASLDVVIKNVPVGREFREEELVTEVRQRGLKERGAVREHLRALQQEGHLRRTDNGWVRLN